VRLADAGKVAEECGIVGAVWAEAGDGVDEEREGRTPHRAPGENPAVDSSAPAKFGISMSRQSMRSCGSIWYLPLRSILRRACLMSA
jgi:hypothetical protein